jgi:hypothetical protein
MNGSQILIRGRTEDEHIAWLHSLRPDSDEYRIVHMAIGHLFNLALVSCCKQTLLTMEMKAGERLKLLDGMASTIFGPVTAEAVAAIEPAGDDDAEMIAEICSLPVGKQTQAFQEGDVFRLLAKLNPSLLRALEICR